MSPPSPTPHGVCLRPYQTDAIERLDDDFDRGVRRVLVVAATGSGKCVTPDTLVWSRGLRRFDEVWGADRIAGPLGVARVTGWYDDGVRDGVRATLDCGLSIDGTRAHRVWSRGVAGTGGWRPLEEVRPGDQIVVALSGADFGEEQMCPRFAFALGALTTGTPPPELPTERLPPGIRLGTVGVVRAYLQGLFYFHHKEVNAECVHLYLPNSVMATEVHQLLHGLGVFASRDATPNEDGHYIVHVRTPDAFAVQVLDDDRDPEEPPQARPGFTPWMWRAVTSVQPSRARRIDCEVEGQQSFLGNGIINHNTTIAASVIERAARRDQRVLFLAHRRELISQAYRRLIDFGLPERDVGVIMANDPRRRPVARVQVASVDTLRHRARPRADVVFIDEAHRALATSYRMIADAYPNALHLGLTATPYRADGKGLGDAYDELLVVASPRQLIAEGYLVEPRVFTVPASQRPDLSRVRVARGDYSANELAAAVDRQGLVGNIVEHWMTHARGLRTVAFAASVEHSRHIAERFRASGVPAEHLDGTTPAIERDAILARLDRGETLVVSNCGVLCEGWDQPAVKCAILARPTKSTGLYLQQAGRILRPWNDQRAIILDHAGCALEHGLPQDDRDFSLEGAKKRTKTTTEAPARECAKCCAVVGIGTRVCPECGHELITTRELPTELEGALVEATAAAVRPRAPPPTFGVDRGLRETLRNAARAGGRLSWDALDAPLVP
jgi:superfamily II DNA or RNA helicase